MDKVRIGVISHAHGHLNQYCNQMQNFDDVDLVANWNDNEERGRENAEKFDLDFRASIEGALDDPNIDTVMIGIETNRHAEYRDGIMGTLFNGSTTVASVNTTEIYGDNGTIVQDYGDAPSTSAPRPDDAIPLKYIQRGE